MAKFRSWSKYAHRFFYWKDGIYYNDIECLNSKGATVLNFNWQNAEQSTGSKDTTGKEIFVGDNIEGNFPYAKKCIVIYDNKMAGCYLQPFDNNKISRPAYSKYYKLSGIKVTIIDNIHENPELVESEDE